MSLNETLTLLVLVGQLVVFWRQRSLMAGQLKLSRDAELRAQRHDRLSVRPFLDFDSACGPGYLKVTMTNHGAGPALKVSLAIYVDGSEVKPAAGLEWPRTLLAALGIKNHQLASQEQHAYAIEPSTTLGPGRSVCIFDFHLVGTVDTPSILSKVNISVQFESLYGTEDGLLSAQINWPPVFAVIQPPEEL